MSGLIGSTDAVNKEVLLIDSTDGANLHLMVNDDTTITVNGADATFSDLGSSMHADATYQPDTMVALNITATSAPF